METLNDNEKRMLVHLFRSGPDRHSAPFEEPIVDSEIGILARNLGVERGVAQYHLDRLCAAGFVQDAGGNLHYNHSYWAITESGRALVIERDLLAHFDKGQI